MGAHCHSQSRNPSVSWYFPNTANGADNGTGDFNALLTDSTGPWLVEISSRHRHLVTWLSRWQLPSRWRYSRRPLFIRLKSSPASDFRRKSSAAGLCARFIDPSGFPCIEHTTRTKDGYVLGLQRVSSPSVTVQEWRSPVLLVHGLFMGGDAWFMDSPNQSLGFILANHGFDVWVGNVRGTHWSHGHISLSEDDKEFWDWSWQELALYDLGGMIHYIYSVTNSKVLVVGHSQGTIMSLAALTQPDIEKMVEAAALLCPISYLGHITAPFVLRLVKMHIDEIIMALGIHELNFKSYRGTRIIDMMCDGHFDCGDMLSSITGPNCCFNSSRIDSYLEYEPHPSSSKNLHHLFQMIRDGTFAMYDYGTWKNLMYYRQLKPPVFDVSSIPRSLPIWMGYGGNDALADVADVQHTIKELASKPDLLYLENYGHIDFLLSTRANEDVYHNMLCFFQLPREIYILLTAYMHAYNIAYPYIV